MKRKVISVIFVTSLILNIVLASAIYYYKNIDTSEYEHGFLREINLAVQRFEEYQDEPFESTYVVAVAHLYSAYTNLAGMSEDKWTYKQLDDFRKLWNYAALSPDKIQKTIPALIDILSLIREDEDFNDTNTLLRLHELISEIENGV